MNGGKSERSIPNNKKYIKEAEQVMAHQPAISLSISLHNHFNRAGGRTSNVLHNMKTFLIALFFVCTAFGTETADELARRINIGWTPFDNGLSHTPEGQREAALTNAEFTLAHFMASDKVPEGVRISYALNKLKAQMRGSSFKEAVRADREEFAFEGDQKGAFVVDGVRTLILREDLPKKIEILENRLVAIYNPHKEAEQDGTRRPATRPESKSDGIQKPQPKSEERSR